MSEEFGAGIFLDEQFDFSVSNNGDLDSTSGLDELQKDLAFQMVIELEQYLGRPPTGNLEAEVAATARDVALADTRIDSVIEDSIDVQFSQTGDEITLKLTVQASDSVQNLVFEV